MVGYFCDKYRTRKAPLVSGFIAMALATVLFISAKKVWVLLVARVCQGLSGAVVGVLGLSMIAETSSPEHLGSHMACGSASLTWGMLCGPMAGGFLYVFWIPILFMTSMSEKAVFRNLAPLVLSASLLHCLWLTLFCEY